MTRLVNGDRVRIDNGKAHHGKHGTILNDSSSESLKVKLADGDTETFAVEGLRPVPNTDSSLYYRERDVLSNIWGDSVPDDIRHVEDEELLWEMRRQISEAVDECYRDDDMDALGILGPLEYKITEVLAERTSSRIVDDRV